MMKKRTTGKKRRRQIWLAVGILLLLFVLSAAWKWTPLAEQISLRKVSAWAYSLRNNPARPAIVLGVYLVGSILMVPITVLIVATALVFGPVLGSAYALAGCFIGALATYAIGYFLGRDFVRQLMGPKWKNLERKINRAGIVAVTTMRLLPVAPFTVVNIISGAFKVPLRDYVIGSFLGFVPGILITNLFAHQLEDAIRNPGPGSLALLLLLIVVTVLGTLWMRRKFAER